MKEGKKEEMEELDMEEDEEVLGEEVRKLHQPTFLSVDPLQSLTSRLPSAHWAQHPGDPPTPGFPFSNLQATLILTGLTGILANT